MERNTEKYSSYFTHESRPQAHTCRQHKVEEFIMARIEFDFQLKWAAIESILEVLFINGQKDQWGTPSNNNRKTPYWLLIAFYSSSSDTQICCSNYTFLDLMFLLPSFIYHWSPLRKMNFSDALANSLNYMESIVSIYGTSLSSNNERINVQPICRLPKGTPFFDRLKVKLRISHTNQNLGIMFWTIMFRLQPFQLKAMVTTATPFLGITLM